MHITDIIDIENKLKFKEIDDLIQEQYPNDKNIFYDLNLLIDMYCDEQYNNRYKTSISNMASIFDNMGIYTFYDYLKSKFKIVKKKFKLTDNIFAEYLLNKEDLLFSKNHPGDATTLGISAALAFFLSTDADFNLTKEKIRELDKFRNEIKLDKFRNEIINEHY